MVATAREVASTATDRFREARWLAVAPMVLGVGGYWAGQLVGYGLVVPDGGPLDAAVAYLLLGTALIVAIAGTLWIVLDARRVRSREGGWHPNPAVYVGGYGAILAAAVYEVRVGSLLDPASAPGATLALFVGGVLVSSVAAGPVYLVNRRQHLAEHAPDGGERGVD